MENVLFDTTASDSLNKLIQTQIASHLFIICNYNPNAFTVINEDAKFLQGIANLYKFTIDTSLINRIKRIDDKLGGIVRCRYQSSISDLTKYLDTISNLRTVAFHNNDHGEAVEKTERWMINTIHKKQPETIADYSKALKELERIGERTYGVVSQIINYMIKAYSKKDLIKAFQEQIVYFYQTNDKLIKEELRAAYLSQSTVRGIVKDSYLAAWCQEMYIGQFEKQLQFFSNYLPSAKGDQKAKLQARIDQIQKQIDETKTDVANRSERCQGNVFNLSSFDYLDFYCLTISQKCSANLSEIVQLGLTMLPQDMIQYIISTDFKSIGTNNN